MANSVVVGEYEKFHGGLGISLRWRFRRFAISSGPDDLFGGRGCEVAHLKMEAPAELDGKGWNPAVRTARGSAPPVDPADTHALGGFNFPVHMA
jgi:hypothetical protein